MKAHKYLYLPDRKQNIVNIELARLSNATEEIPIVITCEKESISVFWWNSGIINNGNRSGRAFWQSTSDKINHTSILDNQEPEPDLDTHIDLDRNKWKWSRRVGVTCAENYVYVVFKREIKVEPDQKKNGLFLNRYKWNNEQCLLEKDPQETIEISLNNTDYDGTGFSLWIGSYNNKLFILTQGVKIVESSNFTYSKLILLSIELSELLNNNSEIITDLWELLNNNWEINIIDDGGYDFDALLKENILTIIYRQGPFSGYLKLPKASLDDHETSFSNCIYEPLFMKQVDLNNLNIINSMSNIPGGEFPQIQSLDPLLITYDRLNEGTIKYRYGKAIEMKRYFARIEVNPETCQKIMYMKTSSSWKQVVLHQYNPKFLPRFLQEFSSDAYLFDIYQIDEWESRLFFAPINNNLPIFIIGGIKGSNHDDENRAIEYLTHHPLSGTVSLRRVELVEHKDWEAELVGLNYLDINHAQIIEPLDLELPNVAENNQFKEFTIELSPYRFQKVFNTYTYTYVLYRPEFKLDNTIGGCLIVERSHDDLTFFAYTDLGDGGCRVILNTDFDIPELTHEYDEKMGITPDMIVDPLPSEDIWLDADSFIQVTRPSYGFSFGLVYPNRSIITGLDILLDSLMLFSSEFEESDLLSIQVIVDSSTGSSENVTSDINQNPIATFHFSPKSPHAGTEITFYADETQNGGDCNYNWNFGNGNTATGVTVKFTFLEATEDPEDPYNITLTVTDGDENQAQVTDTIIIEPSFWDQFWKIHEKMQDPGGMFFIKDCSLTIGCNKISFIHHEIIEVPHLIRIERTPTFTTGHHFYGNGYSQGGISYQILVQFNSQDIKVGTIRGINASKLVKVNSLGIDLWYGKEFSPGILMSDRRSIDPMSGDELRAENQYETLFDYSGLTGVYNKSGALCAKPVSKPRIRSKANVDIKVTAGFSLLSSIISLLFSIGAIEVALQLSSIQSIILGIIEGLITWDPITIGILAIALGILAVFIYYTIPPIIEYFVKKEINETLESSDTLDPTILNYIGEGLAEYIAQVSINQAISNNYIDPNLDVEEEGMKRMTEQMWHMIYIMDGKCRISLPKNN